MASNPFRRPANSSESRPAAAGELRRDATPPPSKSSSAKKKVTIQTPPHSPEDPPRRLSSGNISPPPPPSADDNGDSDSTTTAESELEEAARNTRRNSGSLPGPSLLAGSTVKAPYNPFARTLATQEAAYGVQQSEQQQQGAEPQEPEAQQRLVDRRAPLDVDEFKNILLTGNTTRLQDNSSGTDTSSISRQSLFDPSLETHAETPRSSIDQVELLESPSDSGDESGPDHLDDFVPPTPPKSKHGKVLAAKGPQNVSFADFENSIKPSLSRSATSPASPNEDKKASSFQATSSIARKPVPVPPTRSPTAPGSLDGIPSTMASASKAERPAAITSVDPVPLKKAAPPPPAPRRTEHPRSDSNANQGVDSKAADEAAQTRTSIDAAGTSAAPPPPPARKSRPISQSAAPRTEISPEAPLPTAPSITADTKGIRPPPPPRGSSKSGGSLASALNQASSTGSRTSISRSESPSSSLNAPPAPPPRRSGVNSNRTSIDGRPASLNERRRSSEYSGKAERSTSLSNLENVTETGEVQSDRKVASPPAIAERDILADLSAFQAEIDALRRAGGNGG